MKKLLPKSARNPQGFTLVELLVVITIIAILSVVGITIFTGVQKNARDSRRKADLDSISKALETNYNGSSTTPYGPLLGTWFTGGTVPVDPQNSGTYVYTYTPANITTVASATYVVCADLEAASGGNSSSNSGTAQVNGRYYCKKNQQ